MKPFLLANTTMEPPLTADSLRELLGTAPTTYSFRADQTRELRAATMDMVPEAARRAIMAILLEHVLFHRRVGLCADPQPLLYYMATEDEMVADAELRRHSPDWRLDVYYGAEGALYDFNGWPGDNEDGAGLYMSRAEDNLYTVFTNQDQSLAAMSPEHWEVVEEFAEKRAARRSDTCPSCGEWEADLRLVCKECGYHVCTVCFRPKGVCLNCEGDLCERCGITQLTGDGNSEKVCLTCRKDVCLACVAVTGCQTRMAICAACFDGNCACGAPINGAKPFLWDSDVSARPLCDACKVRER